MADTTLEKIQTLPDITPEKFKALSEEERTRVLREYIEIKMRQAKTRYLDAEGNEITDVNKINEFKEKLKKQRQLEESTTSV